MRPRAKRSRSENHRRRGALRRQPVQQASRPPAALATNEIAIGLRYEAALEAINTALAFGGSDTPSRNANPITTTGAMLEKLKAPVSGIRRSLRVLREQAMPVDDRGGEVDELAVGAA